MKDKEDVEVFLAAIEGHMTSHGVSLENWAKHTLPGDTTSTYIRMPADQGGNYKKIKEKLLTKYHTYRRRLDLFDRKEGKKRTECGDRVLHLYEKWLEGCEDLDSIVHTLALDHLTKILLRSTATHIKDRKSEAVKEAGEMADDFYEVRRWSYFHERPIH